MAIGHLVIIYAAILQNYYYYYAIEIYMYLSAPLLSSTTGDLTAGNSHAST